jgi:cell division GTPase FtsZ
MNILLLSTGGGGGNILRSLKSLFELDVTITRNTDPSYAARLEGAVTTRFLDTNEFALSDLPSEERLLIGARTTGRFGARHNPEVAGQALEESKADVEAVLSRHSVIILIGTGGKGTGAGTIFPLARMARDLKKLVLPIFVRPSFERHEVDKRRYDHALKVSGQFDAAGIRLIEILNDRGYDEAAPKPQLVVWQRMNLPIARGLRGLIYVLWDLCQVDPSDLSMLFAGHGRLRIGFGEIDPAGGGDPSDEQIDRAARSCWDNPYYAFSKPAGTSLVCIHGDWSNIVDAKIKGQLAGAAVAGASGSPYNPLYTRGVQSPRPWGVTALFGEHTGVHPPLEIDWAFEKRDIPAVSIESTLVEASSVDAIHVDEAAAVESGVVQTSSTPVPTVATATPVEKADDSRMPSSLWELAVAVNRSDPAAIAVASNGTTAGISVEGPEVRKLLGTMWFRAIVPRLSQEWQARILEALVEGVAVSNHAVRVGRRTVPLNELDYDQLQEVAAKSWMPDIARADLELLVTTGRLWGREAVRRFRFVPPPERPTTSKLASLLEGLRG